MMYPNILCVCSYSVIFSLEALNLYWNSLPFRGGFNVSIRIDCKRIARYSNHRSPCTVGAHLIIVLILALHLIILTSLIVDLSASEQGASGSCQTPRAWSTRRCAHSTERFYGSTRCCTTSRGGGCTTPPARRSVTTM